MSWLPSLKQPEARKKKKEEGQRYAKAGNMRFSLQALQYIVQEAAVEKEK